MLAPHLKDLLVCPLGKAPLKFEDTYLECTVCHLRFAMTREGYPNMVLEDATLPEGVKRMEQLKCKAK